MSEKVCKDFIGKFCNPDKPSRNEDRIQYMLNHKEILGKLKEWIGGSSNLEDIKTAKDNRVATRKKEEGNDYFKRKKLIESLTCYNDALKYAKFPEDNAVTDESMESCLSITFANRSAVLQELNRLNEALRDCELAISYGYPSRLKHKLYLRQISILIKLSKFKEAEETLSKVKLIASGLDINAKIQSLEKELTDKKNSNTTKVEEEVETKDMEPFEENQQFVNASNQVCIEFSEKKGRHVLSNEDLQMGTRVFKEKPFASVLIPEFTSSHCFHCHKALNLYTFPCRQCTEALYCSGECSQDSWSKYHQYECTHLDFLNSTGIGHLAIRILMSAKPEGVLDAFKRGDDLLDLKNLSIFKCGGNYSDYDRIYSLLDHVEDHSPQDIFQYSLTASLLTYFLQEKTSFLSGVPIEKVNVIGGVLLRHICQLICNAHAITAILSDFNSSNISLSTSDESQVRIASAIYPSASLMNHSCEPNIISCFFEGRNLLVKLTKDLECGDEVYNCYGPMYRRMKLAARQELLSEQYFFNCSCSFCLKENEDGINFADKFECFRCYKCDGPILADLINSSFKARCKNCNEMQNIQNSVNLSLKADELFKQGNDLLEDQKVEDAISILTECFLMRRKILFEYNQDIAEVGNLLSRCYAIIGNFKKSAFYVQEGLAYVEQRFGYFSIEYTRELKKYVELYLKIQDEKNSDSDYIEITKKLDALSEIFL